ncbi:hypothetical protein TNCV_3832381 [Trichonephila clavipes]|nr:hypothetical protein TNCV_3832381 [Trichonephila clavipes]
MGTRNPIPQQNTQLHFKLLADDEMPQMLKLSSFNILPSIFLTLPAGIHPPLRWEGDTEVEGGSSLHQMPGGTGSSLVIRKQLIEGINLGGCWTGNLVALHFKYDQARRRFVEWAQNEIAVVPDFHKRILFSDEAHFWLNGYVNKQKLPHWSEANPQVYVETPLHPEN